jgi:hypothetical protein
VPPASHPTFEVIAFHAPLVEADVLRLPIHTDTGMRILRAPVGLWAAGIGIISAALREEMEAGSKAKAVPAHKRGGRVAPERMEQYRAAWRRYISGAECVTIAKLAGELGISTAALSLWFKQFRAEPSAPVLKPKGRIA